jgi:TonB-dependent SusC/RagA subfamily outer membrane receptor
MKTPAFGLALTFLSVLHLSAQDSLISTKNNVLGDSSFNRGNIQSLYQLMQGRFAGVFIARPGSDLNQNFDARIRGISTILGRVNPLIIVDGIPTDFTISIDPNDIESIEILKGPETAEYGIQGASGVILIRTKRNNNLRTWLSYGVYASVEQKIQKREILTADEFIANGGNDIGGRTNWTNVTTQTAPGMNHQISLGGVAGKFQIRASINYRNFSGIQLETGFQRLNGLINIDGKLLKDHLDLHYTASLATEQAEVGFNSIFKINMQLYPTLPIKFESGAYTKPLLFEQYNTVAMIRESSNERSQNNQLHALTARYNFGKMYVETVSGISYHKDDRQARFSEDQHAFRGGDSQDLHQKYFRYRVKGTVGGTWKTATVSFNANAGVDIQDLTRDSNDEFINFSWTRTSKSHLSTSTQAYFASAGLRSKNLYMNITQRIEGSSALPRRNQWDNFYALKAGYNLQNIFRIGSTWVIESGIGKSGLTNYDSLKSAYSGNSELTYEKSKLFDLGTRFVSKSGRWSAALTRYSKNSSGIIFNIYSNQNQSFQNRSTLKNNGWELEFQSSVIKRNDFEFSTGLNLTTLKTKWSKLPEETMLSGTTGPGRASTYFVAHINGKQYGQLYGPILQGADLNQYRWILKDISGDGVYNMNQDQTTIGQALPKFWLGWNGAVRYQRYTLSFLWQGVFGHSLANEADFLFKTPYNSSYNIIKNSRQLPYNEWSNEFAEKASYMRLQYICFDYKFNIRKFTRLKGVKAYIVVNNLITITQYSGDDPEVRLRDQQGDQSYYPYYAQTPTSNYTPGVDRPETWLPTRSFVVGLQANF